MLVTEEEAKEKWCPNFNSKCVASNCMGWRERIIGTLDQNGIKYPYHPGSPLPDGWTEVKKGFCGLAGEPHA